MPRGPRVAREECACAPALNGIAAAAAATCREWIGQCLPAEATVLGASLADDLARVDVWLSEAPRPPVGASCRRVFEAATLALLAAGRAGAAVQVGEEGGRGAREK